VLVVGATWPSWRLLLLDPTSIDDLVLLSRCGPSAVKLLPIAPGSKERSAAALPSS
jgi:hypothetical protein